MSVVIDVAGLGALLAVLAGRGYRLIGPTVRDGAIVLDDVAGIDDLPRGFTEVQEAGSYRLVERDDDAYFGFASGPHGARRFLSPPREELWSATRTSDGFDVAAADHEEQPMALIGLRACDLAAIAVQDRVFVDAPHPDRAYATRRAQAFTIGVSCSDPGATCFCVSMGTGPGITAPYDLALTELLDADRHEFLVEAGSSRGAAVLGELDGRAATDDDHACAQDVTRSAAQRMGRSLDEPRVRRALVENLEHPGWDDVATRCLSCQNCTLVCPTCFCSTVDDLTDLTGATASHVRRWHSCFALDHSALHGGSVRGDTRSQYRQWLTHKLSTWWDQFGVSGCVGCGRCITWCPVGIDLTVQAGAIADPVEADS